MTDNHSANNPCKDCPSLCCTAVKHLPFLGETSQELFSSMLIGAFPDIAPHGNSLQEDTDGTSHRRPFVTEWLVPAQASACPCLNSNQLCSVYEHRPFACRQFPVSPTGKIHPFCPHAERFAPSDYYGHRFSSMVDCLDLFLVDLLETGGESAIHDFLLQDQEVGTVMLYNPYLLYLLILAGADVAHALSGQAEVLEHYRLAGMEEMTFIVPGTEYCITASTRELAINLSYIRAQMEHQDLEGRLALRLKEVMELNT